MAGDTTPAEPVSAQDGKSPASRGSGSPERGIEIDAATEKRLVRKLDHRLVLLAFLCYMAAFLDRSNIGNAETAGMSEDLGFDNEHYDVSQLRQQLFCRMRCPPFPLLLSSTPTDMTHSGCSLSFTSRTSSSSGLL